MLSPQSKYALRALMFLKENNSVNYIQVSEIADRTNLPKAFLSKITKTLVAKNYLLSKRGKNGGIKLNPASKNVTFYNICEALDEPFVKNECVLFYKTCSSSAQCALHKEFTESKMKLLNYLKNEKI